MEQTNIQKVGTAQSEYQREKMWTFMFSIFNSSSIFEGLRVISEHYLKNDRIPLSYYVLIGLAAAALGWGIDRLFKKKSFRTKIVVTVTLHLISWGVALFSGLFWAE
jgi:sulfite exporter TauE/SafE